MSGTILDTTNTVYEFLEKFYFKINNVTCWDVDAHNMNTVLDYDFKSTIYLHYNTGNIQ